MQHTRVENMVYTYNNQSQLISTHNTYLPYVISSHIFFGVNNSAVIKAANSFETSTCLWRNNPCGEK